MSVRLDPRQVVNAAPPDPELPRLGNRHYLAAVDIDSRFATGLRLPSAPAKKSFASVNSPILACSTRYVGCRFHGWRLRPDTSAAPSSSRAGYRVMRLGCTLPTRPPSSRLHCSQRHPGLERRAVVPAIHLSPLLRSSEPFSAEVYEDCYCFNRAIAVAAGFGVQSDRNRPKRSYSLVP